MKRTLLIISILLCSNVLLAQSRQDMTYLDAVSFMRNNDSVQIEVYYSIMQKGLKFENHGSEWEAKIYGVIEILQEGKTVATLQIHKFKQFSGSKEALDKQMSDVIIDGAMFKVAAHSNTVALLILAPQEPNGVSDTIRRQVFVPIRKADKFQFNSIELATSLNQTTDNKNFFEKVGYMVMPNPSNIYGDNYNKLYYYTELSLPNGNYSGDKAEVQLRVLDGEGHEMYKSSQPVTLSVATVPVLGTAEIDGLPSDSYVLELTLMRNGVADTKVQRVFYYDSGIQIEEQAAEQNSSAPLDEKTLYLMSDFKTMSELELDEHATQSFYGASSNTTKEYKKLTDVESKRMFLFTFWRAADKKTPNAQPLSMYRAMLARVADANKQFSFMKVPGWTTDRGRVLIQFGKPDQIDAQPFATDSKPYMVWQYTSQRMKLSGGFRAEFVFVDRRGSGSYQLVHSNVQGEVYQPNWYANEALRTQ